MNKQVNKIDRLSSKLNCISISKKTTQILNRNFLFKVVLVICGLAITTYSKGQTSIDFSVGSSFQDDFNSQIILRKQLSEKFQGGIEIQYGDPTYRFVETRELRDGYVWTIALPGSFLLQKKEKIALYGIETIGVRFQGNDDIDNLEMKDSSLSSTSLIYEFGLLSAFNVTERINMQSGVSFASANELSPSNIVEYTWVKLHVGGSLTFEKLTLFTHYNVGNAFGAEGDTYKYIWSAELGVRIPFGEKKNNGFTLIQPSF